MIKAHSIKLFLVFFLFIPFQGFASGPYDGIYEFNYELKKYYVSVQEKSETSEMVLMLINATPQNNSWHAVTGTRFDNIIIVNSIMGISDNDVYISAIITFNNVNNATLHIQNCFQPGIYECNFSAGLELDMNKIF